MRRPPPRNSPIVSALTGGARDFSMLHSDSFGRQRALLVGAGALTLSIGTLIGVSAFAQSPATHRDNAPLAQQSIRGKLTVELKFAPGSGAAQDWAAPIKDVDEVILTEDWVLMRKRDAGIAGTLIVPREQVAYINVGE